jgi:hypothetical protein
MSDEDDDELGALRIELMKTEIDHHRLDMKKIELDMKKLDQDLRWEPWKALAAFIAASAAFAGAVLGLASWLSHHPFG